MLPNNPEKVDRPYDTSNMADYINVEDESPATKNSESYALLVSGAIMESDWAKAVEELRNMQDSGKYPNQRNLNQWTERSTRKGGGRRS